MHFSAISPEHARTDIAAGQAHITITDRHIAVERRRWEELTARILNPDMPAGIMAFQMPWRLRMLVQSETLGSAGVKHVAAYTLSLLLRDVVSDEDRFNRSMHIEQAGADAKVIVDSELDGGLDALSLIAGLGALSTWDMLEPPFGFEPNDRWYKDETIGLVLRAQSPAEVSLFQHRKFAARYGSRVAADEYIAADHSVRLTPYLAPEHVPPLA